MSRSRSLESGARRVLGRDLSPDEATKARNYLLLLSKWQRVHRMVGSTDNEWMVIHLMIDSWLFAGLLPGEATSILDLGSGAGVPGVPLAIVLPGIEFTLLESRRRRASFLSEVVRQLQLRNCRVRTERAEDATDLRDRFDAVVMRCAGKFEAVVPTALSLVRPGAPVILSGPPKPTPTESGRWVDVEGAERGQRRHFLVVDKESA